MVCLIANIKEQCHNHIGPVVRKADFVACEQQRLRPASSSTQTGSVFVIRSLNLQYVKFHYSSHSV